MTSTQLIEAAIAGYLDSRYKLCAGQILSQVTAYVAYGVEISYYNHNNNHYMELEPEMDMEMQMQTG